MIRRFFFWVLRAACYFALLYGVFAIVGAVIVSTYDLCTYGLSLGAVTCQDGMASWLGNASHELLLIAIMTGGLPFLLMAGGLVFAVYDLVSFFKRG